MPAVSILNHGTANGDGPLIDTPQLDPLRHQAMTIYASGTFNGATLDIYASPDGVTFLKALTPSLTAPGIATLDLNATRIKATISNAGTTAPDISVIAL